MNTFETIFILGRQPELGLAELESVFGSAHVRPCGETAALVMTPTSEVSLHRFGGSLKLAQVIETLETSSWSKVASFLKEDLPFKIDFNGEGKLQLGLSSYGFPITPQKMLASGLELKKTLKRATGRSVRLVSSNTELRLSSPQVIHNGLINGGYEIVVVQDGKRAIIARTLAEQNIEAYTRRDQQRPKRDAKVGMLPPKLAQIIVNLAVGQATPSKSTIVLDPFCGTGVVLQEASLMGFGVAGSDLEPRMVAYTKDNLEWLTETFGVKLDSPHIAAGDATAYTWPVKPSFVACETYLGRPITEKPSTEILERTVSEVNLILKKFLRNIHMQLESGTRLCVAVPAWQTSADSFRHLPLIDQISDLGYNRVSFEHDAGENLLYYREDQIVARELLVLTRK
jgi:tRNA G10  N-methylase Trm11